MPESVARLLAFLDRVRRRHVRIVLLRASLVATALLLVGWTLVTLASNEGARSTAIFLLGLFATLAVTALTLRVRQLHQFAGSRGQAERVEQLIPGLQGGLLTVVDRAARPAGSDALLGRLAREIEPKVGEWPPHRVWPNGAAWGDFRWFVLAVLLLSGTALLAPMGPVQALFSLFAPSSHAAATAAVQTSGPKAVLGDITLRYLYPTYTKLEPLEVPNTTGEIHAPPGTVVEIRARTLIPWTHAKLVAYGTDFPAEVADGRLVSGRLTVAGEGTWRFESEQMPTIDFRIVPDPDLPPTVAVALPAKARVAADALLEFPFSAKDDYGMVKVVVEVSVLGNVREYVLRTPVDVPLSLSDSPSLAVGDLGLAAGETAKLRVGAWDNDEISGSKPGWSASFELTVEGAAGRAAARERLRAELLAALLPTLADFLVDADPVATDGLSARAYGETAENRYDAFDRIRDGATAGLEARVVEQVSDARRDLVAFARSLAPAGLNTTDAARLSSLHRANVDALESAVYMLDLLQRMAASNELMRLVKQAAQEAQELRDELPKLTDPHALARLDQLTRLWAEVSVQAKKLEGGGIRDFVQMRGAELEGAMAAARRDISTGNDGAAKQDMARVAQLLAELAGGVEEARKRQSGGGEELQKEMSEVRKELEQLGADQAGLRAQTQAAREKFGPKLDEGMKAWEAVDRSVAEVERQLGDASVAAASAASKSADSAIADAKHDAMGLSDSTRGRDAQTARERADTLDYTLQRARSRVQSAARSGELSPEAASQALGHLTKAQQAAQDAGKALEQLASGSSEGSPALKKALRDLSGAQQELADRAQKTAERAQRLTREIPIDASKLGESAQEGAQQAGRAKGELDRGDAMSAEGGQRAAEEAFERAKQALDQAQADMEQLGRNGSGEGDGQNKGGDGKAGGKREAGNTRGGNDEIKIPAPEEFQTPEAYRQALIEGMTGEVPEAYRALNKRYYEELVRQ